ncbi:MAG: L,D-transpeptidase [Anaerolineales bacterium]|nr:L,D-transpeptidase [Anaerolineales bacterium]
MSDHSITRRQFLKLGGAALLSAAFSTYYKKTNALAQNTQTFRLGRTTQSLRYYETPTVSSHELGYYLTDETVKIYETALGDPKPEKNPLWLRTEDGWIRGLYVQPVEEKLNEPVFDVPKDGFLAEVSVPWTQAWINEKSKLKRAYRLYFASTYWVYEVSTDAYGDVWYRIIDDLLGGSYYVLAEHLRPIEASEISPISPEVTDKKIVVNLANQKVAAFENGRMVFAAPASTGTFEGSTPVGEYRIERKQPSRHMAADEGNGFDLPGVPWVCFISWTGVSLHGTYWHHDYGTPRSHGCINLTPKAAKWLFRWTTPIVPFGEDYVEDKEAGTKVIVE